PDRVAGGGVLERESLERVGLRAWVGPEEVVVRGARLDQGARDSQNGDHDHGRERATQHGDALTLGAVMEPFAGPLAIASRTGNPPAALQMTKTTCGIHVVKSARGGESAAPH